MDLMAKIKNIINDATVGYYFLFQETQFGTEKCNEG